MAKTLRFFLIGILAFFLQSCLNVASTGVQVVYNRNNINNTLGDQYISFSANEAIYKNHPEFKASSISIATFHRIVLMTGQVATPELRKKAEDLVRNVPGVEEVHNMLQVSSTSSPLTQVSDAWITTKIKTQLIATDGIDPSQIKVVTENGTVYLMGILLHDDADTAVEIARNTAGVQRVVKVFKYLRITTT